MFRYFISFVYKKKNYRFFAITVFLAMLFQNTSVNAETQISYPKIYNSDSGGARIYGADIAARVAPGEYLPVSVKLLNFGLSHRADVLITYSIVNASGVRIYSEQETVAVETTAGFIKNIQIPRDASPGSYSAVSSIIYQGQETPAVSQFEFTVEPKIFGFFQSDFILYSSITLFSSIVGILLTRWLILLYSRRRIVPHDYYNKKKDERIYYEIISDTIQQMRFRAGDDALEIASNIEGLRIDKETGKVLSLTEHPSKIIATLVSDYEKFLGKKVSFSFRRD